MEQIMNMLSEWTLKLQEFLSAIQYTEALGYVLLTVDAILSALFTEMLFKDKKKEKGDGIRDRRKVMIEQKKRGTHIREAILFLIVSFFFLFLNICITLLLLKLFLHFVPQKESFDILIRKICQSYNIKFLVPLIATVIAGIALKGVTWNKKWAKPLLCFLLAVSAIASSFTFLWDSVQIIQRPHYDPPVESISAIINRRLKVYPFALSEAVLRSIGDGSGLITDVGDAEETMYDTYDGESYDLEPEIYEEPNNFTDYMRSIVDGTYAPGKGIEDYLLSAYNLYTAGNHGDDYFCIGMMWDYLYSYYEILVDEPEITAEGCLDRAIEYYKKQEEIEKSPPLYWNMALVYDILGDTEHVGKCMSDALNLIQEMEKEEGESIYDMQEYAARYIEYIYGWIDHEQPVLLMEDVDAVLEYVDDLSMYILYGACAISENRDVMKAYERLAKADEYYQGKSTMVKILCCICADMLSINDTSYLYEIYQAEQIGGLTSDEELYLIRYLFVADRLDELWGYIDSVGTENEKEFSVEKTAIKAVWYFDSRDGWYQNTDDIKMLLYSVDDKLEDSGLKTGERNLLLLSRSLLRNCLGEVEDVDEEEYESEEMLDIEYIFAATNAFNNAEYDQAIRYCETFFKEEDDSKMPFKIDGSLPQKLTPQEQVTLRYYMQLILAHAHYECAQNCESGSEEWRNHIAIAEKECEAFERSSKSFFYIEERFENLRGFIRQEKGEWPVNDEEKLEMEDV